MKMYENRANGWKNEGKLLKERIGGLQDQLLNI